MLTKPQNGGALMHYDPLNPDHGMQYDPFKALVVPRPIGWISTLSIDGKPNLAPFSFFNALSDKPPILAASLSNGNDTLNNILATEECTVCVANVEQMDAMNMSSAAVDTSVNEFTLAELGTEASSYVNPPRVSKCPAAFECKLWKSVPLPVSEKGRGYTTVILSVVGIYIDDQFIKDGRVDTASMQPLARLGYMDYAVVNEQNMMTLNRPVVGEDRKSATLEGGAWDGVYR